MWVRMARFKLLPDERESAIARYASEGLPRARTFPGNVACYLLEPLVEGQEYVACTIWETEQHARDYETSGAAKEVADMLRPAFAGPPMLETYRTRS